MLTVRMVRTASRIAKAENTVSAPADTADTQKKEQKMIKNRAYVLVPRLADHILEQYHYYEVSVSGADH